MPEIRYYTVIQEREVQVWANDEIEAGQLALAAFNNEIKDDDIAKQHITRSVQTVSLEILRVGRILDGPR